jgi:K+-transporting ATPase KdpF subunit
MKTRITSSFFLLIATPSTSDAAANGPHSYLIGGIIALLIMGYLIYSLIRPEKF